MSVMTNTMDECSLGNCSHREHTEDFTRKRCHDCGQDSSCGNYNEADLWQCEGCHTPEENEIICPCGLEMDDHDTSSAEHDYSRGDYKRKDGDIECDCCRPYFWDCQEVFDELDNHRQRDMSEQVGAAIEALGYTLEYDNHIIIKISGDAGVIYEAEEGVYMEFDTLPADIRRACLQVRYDDLVGLSESHEVPAEDIKKAKDELEKAESA